MAKAEIEDYVEAASAASDRGRFVLLVLITGSILAFAAFWNSREDGWVSQRLHLAKIGLQLCGAPKVTSSDPPQSIGEPVQPDFNPDETKNHLTKNLPPEDKPLIARASEYYEQRHFHSCENLRAKVQGLEKINTEDVEFIHVPFLGFTFDINDLGMLAGITFVVVLIWLRLSLESELRSVRVTFTQAERLTDKKKTAGTEDSDLAFAYRMLGMYQVFTRVSMSASAVPGLEPRQTRFRRVIWWISFLLAWLTLLLFLALELRDVFQPPRSYWTVPKILIDILIAAIAGGFLKNARPEAPFHFWQELSLGLYWLPLIVLLAIFRNDLATLEYGLSVSRRATVWLMSMEVLLLLATWLLVQDCLRIAQQTDSEWNEAEKKIKGVAAPIPPGRQ